MAEQYAREYDLGVEEQSYHGPAVLFGLMFEFLETGDRVLKKNGVFGFTFNEMIPEKSGFEILKQLNFLTFEGKDGYDDFYFTAYIARKK